MTKAETLSLLAKFVSHGSIADVYFFTFKRWQLEKDKVLSEIKNRFERERIIVRSSAINEDGFAASMAGQYLSLPHIKSDDIDALERAISQVFSSYLNNSEDNQILVQPMIRDVCASGVAFTKDQKTGAPYIHVNYDDSEQTDGVTAGRTIGKSLRLWRGVSPLKLKSLRMRNLYRAINELEEILESDQLDIEFAIDRNESIWILQARPLIIQNNLNQKNETALFSEIEDARKKIKRINQNAKDKTGSGTIFSNMADWNPAEMIGVHPSPLAFSLYEKLITEHIWQDARALMSYKDAMQKDLMVKIAGQPFIDVKKSFHSLLPQNIDSEVSNIIVESCLNKLKRNPLMHDKVEFEIIPSCYTPTFESFFEKNYSNILNSSQLVAFKNALLELTNTLVQKENGPGSLKWCIDTSRNFEELLFKENSDVSNHSDIETFKKKILYLLNKTKKSGTLPFAVAARHAFIAEAIYRSCRDLGVIPIGENANFKKSFTTVSHDILDSLAKFTQKMPNNFLEKYGHIRPSSYDIMSPRYDQMSDIARINIKTQQTLNESSPISKKTIQDMEKLFSSIGYSFSALEFLEYYKASVYEREKIKLIFTKALSDILEYFSSLGKKLGFSRQETAFMTLEDLNNIHDISTLEKNISERQIKTQTQSCVHLNYLIENEDDLLVIPVQRSQPNFITFKKVLSETIFLSEKEEARNDLQGKIICIERADPGFDWLFGCNIAGLVTQFGGANSHMAIRCSEYDLPAAIGCGELLFNKLKKTTFAEIDCKAETLFPLN